jgi:hypothetical protein
MVAGTPSCPLSSVMLSHVLRYATFHPTKLIYAINFTASGPEASATTLSRWHADHVPTGQ